MSKMDGYMRNEKEEVVIMNLLKKRPSDRTENRGFMQIRFNN